MKRSKSSTQVGVARFTVRGTKASRIGLLEALAARGVNVFSLARADRGLLWGLRAQLRIAAKDQRRDPLDDHKAVAPALAGLSNLRSFRCAVRAANSKYAATRLLEDLFQVLDSHLALLKRRGIEWPARSKGVAAVVVHGDSTRATLQAWNSEGAKLARASRRIGLLAFEHYVTELRRVAVDAKKIAKRVEAKSVRAAAQHRALSERAAALAEQIHRSTALLRL